MHKFSLLNRQKMGEKSKFVKKPPSLTKRLSFSLLELRQEIDRMDLSVDIVS